MLVMKDLCKIYRTDTVETHALRGLSLTVDEGEFLSVTGPSGSGKTTFLNIAGLLEELTSGTYELDGRDISSLNDKERSRVRNEKIGFIFQSFNLIPVLNVRENVEFPLMINGPIDPERSRYIDQLIRDVGLEKFVGHRPDELARQGVTAAQQMQGDALGGLLADLILPS